VRIGSVAELPVEKARKLAGSLIGAVSEGRSPSEERRAVRAEMTFGQLWQVYAERHGRRKRSFSTDEHRYKMFLEPWASRKVSSIDRADVIRLLDTVTVNSGEGSSNRVRSLAHSLFAKAREWGAEIVNPVSGTPRNKEHPKERYLLPEELGRFLAAVEADHDADTRDFLKLLLFTGVRRGTLCRARWVDLDRQDKLWRVPAEYMKAGRELTIPLAPEAVAIFTERATLAAPEATWVFPGRATAGHTLDSRAGWLRILARAEITGLTQHDLRRSFATYALEAGVQYAVIAAALGHTKPAGATAVYAKVTIPQLRAAVEKTVGYLLTVAKGGGTVIAFPASEAAK
jgi:integrase